MPDLVPWLAFLLLLSGCAANRYEFASIAERASFKHVGLPLPSGTTTLISQGAFGRASHHERGNEFSWDFDVPYGTPVVAVEGGVVIGVWQPEGGAGCDPRFAAYAHNVKVEHPDGTVAQYVHVKSDVKVGQAVVRGQPLGQTAASGWICRPQLHFGVYRSREHLYDSPSRQTIPLFFDGVPEGVLRTGQEITVPEASRH